MKSVLNVGSAHMNTVISKTIHNPWVANLLLQGNYFFKIILNSMTSQRRTTQYRQEETELDF